MSLDNAKHQKPGKLGRAVKSQGEAVEIADAVKQGRRNVEPRVQGEATCLSKRSRKPTWYWLGNGSRPMAAVLGQTG